MFGTFDEGYYLLVVAFYIHVIGQATAAYIAGRIAELFCVLGADVTQERLSVSAAGHDTHICPVFKKQLDLIDIHVSGGINERRLQNLLPGEAVAVIGCDPVRVDIRAMIQQYSKLFNVMHLRCLNNNRLA